jgi:poly(glycerol-phosphate) alpha-glucosyltransferase
MHTICLLESISRADGGIFEAECALQRELFLGQGVQVDVVGLEDPFTAQDAARWLPLEPRSVKVKGPSAAGFSPDLLPVLDPKADLLYAATLWKYPSWAALQWAERTGKPMMAAPHGSLDAWALSNAAWKKKIAAALFKNRQLHKATCLRALCQSEAEAIRAYGLTQPIAVIPNGVDLPDFTESSDEGRGSRACDQSSGRKTLLFLGRIHPKKGIPNLIRAFKKAIDSRRSTFDAPWQLVIAGWDQGGHEAELILLCQELGLSFSHKMHKMDSSSAFSLQSSVLFFGPAFGEEKQALLRRAEAFVLPSFSEGLPMSVLEAWSYRLPVVMTPECNLPEGFATNSAIRIETGVESIAGGLETLFSMSESDLHAMGAKGRALVEERFTWQTIAAQMREVYDWMLGGGATPSSVIGSR